MSTSRSARRTIAALLSAALSLAVLGSPAAAAPAPITAPHVAGEVIVGFRAGADAADRASARRSVQATSARQPSRLATDVEVLRLPRGLTVAAAIGALRRNPSVAYAEPNHRYTKALVSDDPYLTNGTLWGMLGDASSPANQYGSGAAEAWAAGHVGSSTVFVGVIDEGIQWSHPDLDANIWTNPHDPADGVDNDGNGYVDDLRGWDFFNNNSTVFDGNATEGSDSHGTHVAGTIGGEGGNGTGVAGVNWTVKMISGKFLGPGGGSTSGAIAAVDYFTDLKVRHGLNIVATSNSWGGGGYNQSLRDAIRRGGDQGILFVAAAGNNAVNTDSGTYYPQGYDCSARANGSARGFDCVISVASIASDGSLSSFSNYGATSVDLGAPGSAVTSTVPTNSYASYNGTSMATPHVSGAIALCAAMNPALDAQALRGAVIGSVAPTASLSGRTATGGRLDVGAMTTACLPPTTPVSGSPSNLVATATTARTVALTWTDGVSNESSYQVERATVSNGACGAFALVATVGANATAYTASGLSGSTEYCFQVRGANGYLGGSFSAWSNVARATTPEAPQPYACSPIAYGWVDATAGTLRALGDDTAVSVALPFTVTWHGDPFTSLQVSSNGFVRFGSGSATSWTPAALPAADDPNAIAAAFWDDLVPNVAGAVYTTVVGSAPNRRFIASWNGIPHYNTTNGLTFQLHVEEGTGAVQFHYLDVIGGSTTIDRGAFASIGVENAAGDLGTTLSFNTSTVINDGTAFRCAPAATGPVITTAVLGDGTTGSSYDQTVGTSGGTAPVTLAVTSGALPAGLSMAADGRITGIPTATGTATFTVTATDAAARTSDRVLAIRVAGPLSITTSSLPSGTAGSAYSTSLAASGGTSPYAWSIASGSLPSGYTLSSAGTISGTTAATGTFNVTVRATDAGSPARSVTRALSLTVAAPAVLPGAFGKSAPRNGAKGIGTSVTLSWAASANATSYEYCVDRTADSVCSTSWVSTGTNRSVVVSVATRNATFYWQVRAVNANGTTLANAGSWWRFITAR